MRYIEIVQERLMQDDQMEGDDHGGLLSTRPAGTCSWTGEFMDKKEPARLNVQEHGSWVGGGEQHYGSEQERMWPVTEGLREQIVQGFLGHRRESGLYLMGNHWRDSCKGVTCCDLQYRKGM